MKNWVVGIGCRRGVSVAQIRAAIIAALGDKTPEPLARVRALASIETKRDETALLEFAASHQLPIEFFSRERVALVQTAASKKLRALAGVDGVCEPCALMASRHGRIVRAKIAMDGVTVAIAEDHPDQHTDQEARS